jgi:hypothetical protein
MSTKKYGSQMCLIRKFKPFVRRWCAFLQSGINPCGNRKKLIKSISVIEKLALYLGIIS